MTRVLICGNVIWQGQKETSLIEDVMEYHVEKAEQEGQGLAFISGMAVGADEIAWELAYDMGVFCDEFPWNKWGEVKAKYNAGGKDPGPNRNQWMKDSGVDVCHAFAYDLLKGSGTTDMVNRCQGMYQANKDTREGEIPCYWTDIEGTHRLIDRKIPYHPNHPGEAVQLEDLLVVTDFYTREEIASC